MPQIDELQESLRDLINASRRHAELRRDERIFSQLCSALDLVGDTEAALDAYLNSDSGEPSIGECYLRTYGLLQALIVQQDAVRHIAESLSVEYVLPEGLRKIREIRNDAVGHPSQRRDKLGLTFNHISQRTLSSKGFDLVTFRSNCPPERRSIDLPLLIERQRQLIAAALQQFVDCELRREAEHRQTFRSTPLASAFPATLEYTLQKLAEEIASSHAIGVGLSLLDDLSNAITNFERQLRQRGKILAIEDTAADPARAARHAVRRLHQFFSQDQPEAVTREDAEAFLFRLRHEVDALRGLAREIDELYSSDPTV